MAKAGHPSALSAQARERAFGAFEWKKLPGNTRAICILDGWDERNIVTVTVPQLAGVDTYGGHFSGNVEFNRQCAAQLQAAWHEVQQAGLLDLVLFWDGSFVPRCIGGTNRLSPHSWGIAFDINARWNGQGSPPRPTGAYGSVVPLVSIFEAWGFAWGGWFGGRWVDGMHFEVCEPNLTEPLRPRLVINGEPVAEVRMELRDGHNYGVLGPMARAVGDTANVKSTVMMPVAEYLCSHGYTVTWAPKEGPRGTVVAAA